MNANKLSGALLINKSAGFTSHDIVALVRQNLNLKRVGHTGTLDPFATGLLLVAVGSATRLIEYTHSLPKTYATTIILGQTTETLDPESPIIPDQNPNQPTAEYLKKALYKLSQQTQQIPPQYSAIKTNGQRAYKKARAGESTPLKSRPVTIHQLSLTNYTYPKVELKAEVSTGTYIRSLARDLGFLCNTTAYCETLDRLAIGNFSVKQAISVKDLSPTFLQQNLLPPSALIQHLPKVKIDNVAQFKNGREVKPFGGELASGLEPDQPIASFSDENIFIGISKVNPYTHLLKPIKVLA